MQFIHERTDYLLHHFLEEIEIRPQTWRVITIEFHENETVRSDIFQNLLLKNIPQFFDETDARIFWHKPGFVLVFFKGRVRPIELCVEKLLKEVEFKGVKKFFDILDLSIHWTNLLQMIDQVTLPRASTALTIGHSIKKNELSDNEFKITLSEDRVEYLKPSRLAREKPVILLVEDDALIIQLVKPIVKEYFDVVFAETMRQAIIYYQRHLPDMVFMDINLPDGSGIDLLEDIIDADSDSYVVMLSAQCQPEEISEAIKLGAKKFIPKPFTRTQLSDVIQQFLSCKNVSEENA